MTSAKTVADYLLTLAAAEEDESGLSHLKLQKLLYYSQGIHLAMTGEPLFEEAIEAWKHGPVVASLYPVYRDYGSNPIPAPVGALDQELTEDQREIVDEVYQVYGQFTAWRLRQMTHDEPPWKNTDPGETISHSAMKSYFETQLVDG